MLRGRVYTLCVLFLCLELFLLRRVSTCCAIYCVSMKNSKCLFPGLLDDRGLLTKTCHHLILHDMDMNKNLSTTSYLIFFDNNCSYDCRKSSSSAVGAEMQFSRQNNRFEGQFVGISETQREAYFIIKQMVTSRHRADPLGAGVGVGVLERGLPGKGDVASCCSVIDKGGWTGKKTT